MNSTLVDDLLEQAEHLARREERGRPKQASLRRAVSSAYYAVFHQIIDDVVAQFIGSAATSKPIGLRLRRTIQHASVKTASNWFRASPPRSLADLISSPPPRALQQASDIFISLQGARHRADYDFEFPFSRETANRHVRNARRAVELLRSLPPSSDRTVFLLCCMLGEDLLKNQPAPSAGTIRR